MDLEIIYFAGALVLLVALIYGTLSYHYCNRAADRLGEEVTRRRYLEEEDAAGVCSRLDRPPAAQREPNGVEPAFSEDDINASSSARAASRAHSIRLR